MEIKNVWKLAKYPKKLVIELGDRRIKVAEEFPQKVLKEEDLKNYTGYHPSNMEGIELEKSRWEEYGFIKG